MAETSPLGIFMLFTVCIPIKAAASIQKLHSKGSFTNYVTYFLLFFEQLPIHRNVLVVTLLMIYHTRVCNSNTFADHPPTPSPLLICEGTLM